jgi:hypothetical protein
MRQSICLHACVGLIAIACATIASEADACTCGEIKSISEARPTADVLIQGTVTSVWPSPGIEPGDYFDLITRNRIHVEQMWTGLGLEQRTVDVYAGLCSPGLRTGESYLVFAHRTDAGHYLVDWYCTPTQPWDGVSSADRELLGTPAHSYPSAEKGIAESRVHRVLRFVKSGLVVYRLASPFETLGNRPRSEVDPYLRFSRWLVLGLVLALTALQIRREGVKPALLRLVVLSTAVFAAWKAALLLASLAEFHPEREVEKSLLVITWTLGVLLALALAGSVWRLLRRSWISGVLLAAIGVMMYVGGCALWGYLLAHQWTYGYSMYFQ